MLVARWWGGRWAWMPVVVWGRVGGLVGRPG